MLPCHTLPSNHHHTSNHAKLKSSAPCAFDYVFVSFVILQVWNKIKSCSAKKTRRKLKYHIIQQASLKGLLKIFPFSQLFISINIFSPAAWQSKMKFHVRQLLKHTNFAYSLTDRLTMLSLPHNHIYLQCIRIYKAEFSHQDEMWHKLMYIKKDVQGAAKQRNHHSNTNKKRYQSI